MDSVTKEAAPRAGVGGTFGGGLRLDPGYTVLEAPLSRLTRAGQERVTTEIFRNFAVVARNEFVATFSE